jgi:hypothetical protein
VTVTVITVTGNVLITVGVTVYAIRYNHMCDSVTVGVTVGVLHDVRMLHESVCMCMYTYAWYHGV